MAFHLGSLGFLTPFQFHNFQDQVTNVLEGHAALTLRSRLRCVIYRKSRKDSDIQPQKGNCCMGFECGAGCSNNTNVLSNAKNGANSASTNILVRNFHHAIDYMQLVSYVYCIYK